MKVTTPDTQLLQFTTKTRRLNEAAPSPYSASQNGRNGEKVGKKGEHDQCLRHSRSHLYSSASFFLHLGRKRGKSSNQHPARLVQYLPSWKVLGMFCYRGTSIKHSGHLQI